MGTNGVHRLFFEMAKIKKFLGLSANRLEIKLRIQRGMTFLDLTLIFFIAAKKLIFYGEKMGFRSFQKYDIQIFAKKPIFLSSFSIAVWPNQGVQLKDRLF